MNGKPLCSARLAVRAIELECLRDTYVKFGVDPQSVQYVECHATGTPQGDGTELDAMLDEAPSGLRGEAWLARAHC